MHTILERYQKTFAKDREMAEGCKSPVSRWCDARRTLYDPLSGLYYACGWIEKMGT